VRTRSLIGFTALASIAAVFLAALIVERALRIHAGAGELPETLVCVGAMTFAGLLMLPRATRWKYFRAGCSALGVLAFSLLTVFLWVDGDHGLAAINFVAAFLFALRTFTERRKLKLPPAGQGSEAR